jgi:uncharacterized membrane protein
VTKHQQQQTAIALLVSAAIASSIDQGVNFISCKVFSAAICLILLTDELLHMLKAIVVVESETVGIIRQKADSFMDSNPHSFVTSPWVKLHLSIPRYLFHDIIRV